MKSRFLTILLSVCACFGLARAQQFNPIALTPQSYTEDIVVEASAPQAFPQCVNADIGSGFAESDYNLYEQGFYARAGQVGGNSGVPLQNTVFTNINNPDVTYLMPPDYTQDNDVMVDDVAISTYGNPVLTFSNPTTATNLSLLATAGSGPTTIAYQVNHADGVTTETGTITIEDWFSGASNVVWGADGCIQNVGAAYSSFVTNAVNDQPPYLYGVNIAVSDQSPVTSITFSDPAGTTSGISGHAHIFGVSGNESGTVVTPIPLTTGSFNAETIAPASFPLTATMDKGTNTQNNSGMNTWFEQGYDRGLGVGLPPSGSTFQSLTQQSHTYQMGDYTTNNAILIDANHLLANITPASPAAYSALSFLTAGGDIQTGNTMTNVCIIQHQDGVDETNLFYGYDWFDTANSGLIAFEGGGRVNMYNRTLNDIGETSFVPYLFESYFPLTDTTSPVTNIVVKYLTAPASTATTYIMALSGSVGGFAPVIQSGPSPSPQSVFVGQTAKFTVTVTGTAPITSAWAVQNSDGSYTTLHDGVDANGSVIYGSTTTSLIISNVTTADAGTYQYTASNPINQVSNTGILNVAGYLTWSGANSGVWDIDTTTNWTLFGVPVAYQDGTNVLMDDTASGTTDITLETSVSPLGLIINNNAKPYSITSVTGLGGIVGANGFTKMGSNSLTLNITNSYTGNTLVSNGVVTFGPSSASAGAGQLFVGSSAGRAVVNFNSTNTLAFATTSSSLQFYVGGNGSSTDTGAGAVYQNSGTVDYGNTGANYLTLGAVGTASYGYYHLSGGTLYIPGGSGNGAGIRVAYGGLGSWVQTGGTLDCGRYFSIGGDAATGNGVATFIGGAVVVNPSYRFLIPDTANARAVMNVGTEAGGNVSITTLSGTCVAMENSSGGNGTLNLNSGTMQLGGPITRNNASGGSAVLNLNGGTIQAGANNITLINANMTNVNVFNGGIAFDSQTNTCTVAAVLGATIGNGIYPANGIIAINSGGGSGYIGAPLVTITGGSGSGAMAIANFTNGTLVNVAITSPGQGYVAGDNLTFAFAGGGALVPASSFSYTLQAADVAANSKGGVTKLGTGKTVMTAASTYTGGTTVTAGTLDVQSDRALGSGNVTIANGATLILEKGATNGYINSAASLIVGSTGVANLSYTGTDSINKLSVDGGNTFVATGTWGSSTSGAANVDNTHFTGTGILNVLNNSGGSTINTNSTNIVFSVTSGVANQPGQLNLAWPTDHTGWTLQMQTNSLTVGLSTNWTDVVGSTLTNQVSIPLTSTNGSVFFRLKYVP